MPFLASIAIPEPKPGDKELIDWPLRACPKRRRPTIQGQMPLCPENQIGRSLTSCLEAGSAIHKTDLVAYSIDASCTRWVIWSASDLAPLSLGAD